MHTFRKIDAILKHKMRIPDPRSLSMQEYHKTYAEFLYLRGLDREFLFNTIRGAIVEAFNGKKE